MYLIDELSVWHSKRRKSVPDPSRHSNIILRRCAVCCGKGQNENNNANFSKSGKLALTAQPNAVYKDMSGRMRHGLSRYGAEYMGSVSDAQRIVSKDVQNPFASHVQGYAGNGVLPRMSKTYDRKLVRELVSHNR